MDAALILARFPSVGMAEEPGLDLAAWAQDGQQFGGIFQAACFDRQLRVRLMMNQNQRGFAGVGVQRAGQPRALRFPEKARSGEGLD